MHRLEKPHLKNILDRLWLPVFPALLVLITECIQRGDITGTARWLLTHTNAFVLNYAIALLFCVLLVSIVGSIFAGLTLTSLVMVLLAVVNLYKVRFLGEPVFPWDIYFYKHVTKLFPLIYREIGPLYLIALLLATILVVLVLRVLLPRFSIRPRWRVGLGLLALAMLILVVFYRSTPAGRVLSMMGVQNLVWNQKANYDYNGLLLGFALNSQSAIIIPPEGYSRKTVLSIINKMPFQSSIVAAQNVSPNRPNIIILMNEGFWDPTELKKVSFSADPLPTLRWLQAGYTSGQILSPTFGGGTANVEFEVLTGFSNTFLPSGSIPYQQYVKRPMPSLASVLPQYGYRSIAIHPFHKWFWNRTEAYKMLGFQEFIGLDDFKNPEVRGLFISDAELSRAIIKQVDSAKQPLFIYAISMQNHGPYEPNRYKAAKVKLSGNISDASLAALATYTQGVADADSALRLLIEHFKDSGEPTVLVFFGDHLPLLGQNYSIYKEAGFVPAEDARWTLEEYKRMRSVPIVIWTNFSHQKYELNTISPSFLAPYVLKFTGIKEPQYYVFLEQLSRYLPGFSSEVKIDSTGGLHKEVPGELKAMVEDYRMLQYDLMFGKQYGKDLLFGK